ncbi:MAG: DUF3800 domain-containing protein [Rhodospirillales bacterium]|nr:DUF3800 domain-containing protein [Rhodospirillales bacterium]MCB9979587.1 DUF3800 domain-containing protein [Rhodospirillales bacterium]
MAEETKPNMFLVYIDESYDRQSYVYSAIFVPAFEWNMIFQHVLDWRKSLHAVHGIAPDCELHATEFVGGQGQPHQNRDKNYRARLFHEALKIVETLPNISVMNAITDDKKKYMKLFEYMLNRINRTLEAKNAYGVLVCDEGNENQMVSMTRAMKKHNVIPSDGYHRHFGVSSRNITLERIIEDPLFKTSKSSYFIQLADFIAFSLLRNEHPVENTKDNVKQAFENLDNCLIKEAFRKDPKGKGIIRV